MTSSLIFQHSLPVVVMVMQATIRMFAMATWHPCLIRLSSMFPEPDVDPEAEFKFLVTLLDRDNFVGRILTGRIESGKLDINMPIHAMDRDGNIVEKGRATKVMAFRGLERVPVDSAQAGDIISLAGLTEATVANTICDPEVTEPLEAQPIDPPTLSMNFSVNDSPMAGREGGQGDQSRHSRSPAS